MKTEKVLLGSVLGAFMCMVLGILFGAEHGPRIIRRMWDRGQLLMPCYTDR